ncbi:putative GEM-like protein 8 isoform X2 [Arachis ipaensis]|uniref:putative GEM-like protein 8 isoform X2 n=1 Tax=Arachis ipaensis TaxID=130454 RepID=UPI000A2AF7DA|nr:putative GEM-like protein 8 isoform X2 [Arachis ipaensis]XP_025685891.1 putative GEM-like protein 8 isoform X2 [Arachis hypogaea]
MKKGNLLLQELVTSIPIISRAFGNPSKRYLAESCSGKYHNKSSAKAKKNMMRLGGMKTSNTMKVKKNFIQLFGMKEREKLLKASQCYLSTTSGPISGILFISTHKVAFCSDRSIKIISSPEQDFNTRIHYKVAIPVEKINCVNQSQNVEKPSEKYIEIVTEDNFDFWFMGFLNYQKTFKYLQQAMFSHA